jgi:hypothetical protein
MSAFKGYVVTAPDGKTYDVNAPEGTNQEDLYRYVQQTYYGEEGPPVQKSAPIGSTAPSNNDVTVPSQSLEEVPGAREFLDNQFRKGASFGETRAAFNTQFTGAQLPAGQAKIWAAAREHQKTPSGRKYYETNSISTPVNRFTGKEDTQAPDSILGEFGTSAKRSLATMANTVTGAAALGSDLVGADETAASLVDTYLEKQSAIAQNYPTSSGSFTDIGGVEDAARWAAATAGEFLPNITSSLGVGAAGVSIAKKLAQRGVTDFVEAQVAKGVTREIAEQQALAFVNKKAIRGGVIASAGPSLIQESGSIYGDTYGETGERKPWQSLMAGTAAAALDTILPAHILNKLGGREVNDAIVESMVKKLGKEATSTLLLEGGTEALQTIIEQLPAGKPINWDNVIEAGFKGAFGGATAGAVTSAYTHATRTAPTQETTPTDDSVSAPAEGLNKRSKVYKEQLAKTQDDITNHINTITTDWKNAPAFVVHDSFKAIDGVDNNSIGAYHEGKTLISAENVIKEANYKGVEPSTIVSAVTFHEGLGHHGLSELFGEELDATFSTILDQSQLYRTRVDKWMAKNPKAYQGDPNKDLRAFEELLAEGSENGRLPASIVNVFKNKVKDFGRKMGLSLEYSTREVETILGMAHSAVVNGKGSDVRANGYSLGPKYMYGGGKAAEAPEESKRWFKGPDGKNRFEFSDKDTYLDERKLNIFGTANLSDVLTHPELFKHYPQLKSMRVKEAPFADDLFNESNGSYDPSTNTVQINPYTQKDKKSILLHEIQHSIQEIENFSRGGNPASALLSLDPKHVLKVGENVLKWVEKTNQKEEIKFDALNTFWQTDLAKQWSDVSSKWNAVVKDRNTIFANLNKKSKTYDEIERDPLYSDLNKQATELFGMKEKLEQDSLASFGLSREDVKSGKKMAADWQDVKRFFNDTPENISQNLKRESAKVFSDGEKERYLRKGVDNVDISLIRANLKHYPEVAFQAYESLVGEVEARDTERRSNLTDKQRETEPRYNDPDVNPSSFVENYDKSLPYSKNINRYMMVSKPENIKFTAKEIEELSPEDLFDTENGMHILRGMTEGYTPTVMDMATLEQEVRDRGLSPSKVIRKNGIGPGELVKRLYMYDIAVTKMNEKLSKLWEKIETGKHTVQDAHTFVQTTIKRDELAARILDEQGEYGRAVNAMKGVVYTKRSIKGMQETLAQFKKGSPFEALNDPEVFYKFAKDIQDQIKEGEAKAAKKNLHVLGNALNLPRALVASMDFSIPLRQALFLIHRKEWWRSLPSMFRYAGSKSAFDDLSETISNDSMYDTAIRSGLSLSNMGSKFGGREEFASSQWADHIPLVAGSNRGAVGYLNKLRFDVFKNLVNNLPDGHTEAEVKALASYVNAATGRGDMWEFLEKSSPVLNAGFFSPRLNASRFKIASVPFDPRTYLTMPASARKEYTKSILAVGGTALLINTLAGMGGADTEKDARSSDFGKIKVGDTRYDILGGEGQVITLAARIAQNSYKTQMGEVKEYGNGPNQKTQLDAIGKFATNKAAPVASFFLDYFRGEDAVGKKFKGDEAVLQRFIPMFLRDVYTSMQEHGVAEGVARSAPGLFGVGVQTYNQVKDATEEEQEAPESFKMGTAADGEYSNAAVEDGVVTLDDKAKKEWASRINFYFKEWMKDEMADKAWKTKDDKAKMETIKEVRKDARKEAKADMLDLLNIPEEEEVDTTEEEVVE